MWNTGGTPEKFENGTLTNFHLDVKSLWKGGLSKNLLEDFNNDNKGWANKVTIINKHYESITKEFKLIVSNINKEIKESHKTVLSPDELIDYIETLDLNIRDYSKKL